MLVLSRKLGEQVVVGDNIRVTVVAIRGDKVRLGFTAPSEIPVHREEVYCEIQRAGGGSGRWEEGPELSDAVACEA